MPITLKTQNKSFWLRIRREFLGGFLVVSIIMLYVYATGKGDFPIGWIILATGVVYMAIALLKARDFIDEISITDSKLIVRGDTFNTRWEKEIDIRTSDIKIKSTGRGRGRVDYYVRIVSTAGTVDINRSFNWDYASLLTLFNEFKRIKGEKIIFDEKYFLDIMEKKARRSGASGEISEIKLSN